VHPNQFDYRGLHVGMPSIYSFGIELCVVFEMRRPNGVMASKLVEITRPVHAHPGL